MNMASNYKMLSSIKKSLEYYFNPDKILLVSEFSPESVRKFYNNVDMENKLFDLISVEWARIDWNEVSNLDIAGWSIIDFLDEASYKHVFPSLVWELATNSNFLTDLFVDNHLNVENIHKDWELKFYFSFDNELKNLIRTILMKIKKHFAQMALESYWL